MTPPDALMDGWPYRGNQQASRAASSGRWAGLNQQIEMDAPRRDCQTLQHATGLDGGRSWRRGEMMSPEAIRLVRSTFAQILPVADLAAGLFYDRLFTLDPALRGRFAADLEPQKHALMAALGLVIGYLDRPEKLVPIVEKLGVRHAGYGLQAAHYATVGSALLWTLEQGLGPAFTPQVRSAWTDIFDMVTTTMRAAADSADLVTDDGRPPWQEV